MSSAEIFTQHAVLEQDRITGIVRKNTYATNGGNG